ncbi:MAG: hypothetical protein V3V20_02785 [Algisphaera sp.]
MKSVIGWMKSNMMTVLSALLIILSVGFMGWIKFSKAPAMRASATQPQKDITRIRSLQGQMVTVPPSNADDPPEEIAGLTINQPIVDVMGEIYGGLNREADDIIKAALGINRAGHDLLVEALFPDTPADMRFTAKNNYGKALQALMGNAEQAESLAQETGMSMPYLNAGMPLADDELSAFMGQRQAEATQTRDQSAMTEAEKRQMKVELQRELMNRLLEHAERFNIYGNARLGNSRNPNPDFPLEVATLATSPQSPEPAELWEGQLQLWIMEDLVQAIARANDVANERDHGVDEDGERIESSVLNAPVKRLLRAELIPGYVGLHSAGGVGMLSSNATTRGSGAYGPPKGGMTDQAREIKLSDNFHYGPTGRGSNQIFDVRHARVHIHVDYQQLPTFFNAISQTNLMTVLDTHITALDVYGPEVLGAYYVYGAGDIVDAELIIETVWLRDWTKELMPDVVQQYVGLTGPSDEVGTSDGGGYDGGGGPPPGYGGGGGGPPPGYGGGPPPGYGGPPR